MYSQVIVYYKHKVTCKYLLEAQSMADLLLFFILISYVLKHFRLGL